MNTHLVFNRITKTESIEVFALSHIENVLEKFKKLLGTDNSTVRLSMLNAPAQAGPDTFACEILVKSRATISMPPLPLPPYAFLRFWVGGTNAAWIASSGARSDLGA